MENNYDIKLKYARKLLDIALENDKLKDFIFCYGGYENYTHDSMGNKEPSIDLIMKSIYSKCKELDSLPLDFYNILLTAATNYKSGYSIIQVLKIIEYHYRQENLGAAPFKMNMSEILKALKNNVHTNRECFERKNSEAPEGYIPLINNHDKIIESYFGTRIL